MHDLLSKTTAAHLKESYLAQWDQCVGHLQSMNRLNRAYEILTRSTEYTLTLAPLEARDAQPVTVYLTGPHDTYEIIPSLQHCTCPDTEKLCKHRLLVKVLFDAIRITAESRRGASIVSEPASIVSERKDSIGE